MRITIAPGASAFSLAKPHQFLCWHDDTAYLVTYRPTEAGKAQVVFALADLDYQAAWTGGSETVDIECTIRNGGYAYFVKWAETVIALECDYAEAEQVFEQQTIAAHVAA